VKALLTIGAVLLAPPLGFAAYVVFTNDSPYRAVVDLCELSAGVGGCFAAIGGMLHMAWPGRDT
jgi:hypothetical protein